MIESILTSIKKLLGIEAEYDHFDQDIIMHINTQFFTLNQLGVGPETPFMISDASATWAEFTSDMVEYQAVKSLIYCNVRLLFDPPSSSFVLDSLHRTASEMEWRLNVQAERGLTDV